MVQAYAPLQPVGFAKVAPPHPFRDRGAGTDEELVERRATELRQAILREGAETVSAVILEPILSSGGFIIPPLGWLRAVRAICDELEVLMIADEVITGFGRTGKWFAVEHESVVPDLMSVAKGITSGYVPLSASIARDAPSGRNVEPHNSHWTVTGRSCIGSRFLRPQVCPIHLQLISGNRRLLYAV
jgi:adenosylmethionine-8-amino-7-oxononanoate aminotransferase